MEKEKMIQKRNEINYILVKDVLDIQQDEYQREIGSDEDRLSTVKSTDKCHDNIKYTTVKESDFKSDKDDKSNKNQKPV